jgi:hypothetical protein
MLLKEKGDRPSRGAVGATEASSPFQGDLWGHACLDARHFGAVGATICSAKSHNTPTVCRLCFDRDDPLK